MAETYASLSKSNFNVTAYSRSPIDLGSSITHLSHPSLKSFFSDPSSLTKFDSIVYAAGRAHSVSGILSISCVSKYLNDNTFDPLYIARLASLAGVERFIYISSIKVNGDSTPTPIYLHRLISIVPRICMLFRNLLLKICLVIS